MTNIRAVSKLAGVSIATVSRTLSTPDVVSDKTRKKVEQAVKEAGYKPNQLARNFRASKSFAIMVLVPNIANPFFSRVISGIQEAAKEQGYSVLLGNTRGSIERENEYAQMVHSYQADGIIQLSARYPLKEIVPLSELPLVNICECFEYPPTPKIELDNIGAARAMTQHLISHGHKRIAVIKGPAENTLTLARMKGYQDAMQDLGLAIDDNLIAEGDFTIKSGFEAFKIFNTSSDLENAILLKDKALTFSLLHRSSTLA
jgi:LacI family repressor for deo operon, udp, cdd, tsx, nupC, and nupG